MAATTISRASLTDDDGTGTLGDIINAALIASALYDKIDALLAANIVFGGTVTDGLGNVLGSPLLLLKATSGTTTQATPQNVDTIALSGLTAKDTLLIVVNVIPVTQPTASLDLYNSTDSVTICQVTAGLDVPGTMRAGMEIVRQGQAGATTVDALAIKGSATAATESTFTTAWTGSWTLALRQGGVTAGGTLRWSWAVYKIAGQ
jgi:hypothetical protein